MKTKFISLFILFFLFLNVLSFEKSISFFELVNMNHLIGIASVNAEEVWDCNQPVKDSCRFTVTINMDLGILEEWLGTRPEVGATVDLTDLTQLYSKGGTFRCGEDITCYTLVSGIL